MVRAKQFAIGLAVCFGAATILAAGVGTFQDTKDGKTKVWNSAPRAGDIATWTGGRDREGYGDGFGTLTWYTRKSADDSEKPVLYARYFGNMIHGKFHGPVNVHTKGRTSHAMFLDGERRSRWTAGTTASWRASQPPSEKASVAAAQSRENKREEAKADVPAEGPAKPTAVKAPAAETAAPPGEETSAKVAEASPPITEAEPPKIAEASSPMTELPPPAEGPARPAEESTPAMAPTIAAVEPPAEPAATAPPAAPAAKPKAADDSLRMLVGPPSALRIEESAPPSEPENTNLTREEALKLADAAASNEGFHVEQFQRADPKYNAAKSVWLVTYDQPPAGGSSSGKHFKVIVDDKTRKTMLKAGR